jgi:quinoprotein glucose dehydrogenase
MMAQAAKAGAATAAPAAGPAAGPTPPDTEWRHYANDLANTKYAPLDQINASNFNNLQVAWRFKTDNFGSRIEQRYECTPILIKGRLFVTAGSRRAVVSLDAATGEILWSYRYDDGIRGRYAPRQLSGRGVAYWTDGTEERILFVTAGYRMIALDAKTGDPIQGFGDNGVVDLKQNIDQPEIDLDSAEIGLHSAPTIANDVVIIGAAHLAGNIPANRRNVKGYVRGFDVRTGKRLWILHTIPLKGEFGYDTWAPGDAENAGNAGAWAQIAADEELGLAYIGVELPSGDSSGMFRRGAGKGPEANLFSESIVAVDTRTGQRRWHYQLVHHGLWDMDVPCAAILCDIPVNGKIVKALAQPTKQSWLYVLDRETGKPIWPIPEKRVPKGDVPGEWYSPTQPHPSKPPAYDVQGVTPDVLIDFTPELHAKAVELIKNYVIGPVFTPPTVANPNGTWGTLHLPNATGGSNWPGGAYDPETHTAYVYSKTNVSLFGMVEADDPTVTNFPYVHAGFGANLRRHNAMGGGEDFIYQTPEGAPATAPPLREKTVPTRNGFRAGEVTIEGLPLIKPPYGRITALDLTKGDIAWQVAHGETPDSIRNHPKLKGLNIPRTGQGGNIGPMVTKSLVICGDAGTFTDERGRRGARLRAYDKATGEEKGEVFIPAPQTGTPMTYMLGGRQYLVVAIGGAGMAGELWAFRLPAAEPADGPVRGGAGE